MNRFLPRCCFIVSLLVLGAFLFACTTNTQNQNAVTTTANTNKAPAPQPAQAPTTGSAIEGVHDIADCTSIIGWVWDKGQPNAVVSVDIYDGTTLLATVPANVPRPDLLNAGKGNGAHGFSYAVPPRLKDGKPHSIRVKVSGTNNDLNNTPKDLTCAP
jgi:hypothetical protein